ncbi:MAG: thiamine-phosphate kinase [Ktedonobacteraceae bacterium]|nr:thiamine-phosphate kinase [Ktedonobacteraceae bacterium]
MDGSSGAEFELIAHLTRGLPPRSDVALGVGDDCAILDLNGDTLLLATSDSQVEGVHFKRQFSSPEQVGRKALAVNLSDIAAMGGEPRYALISLILPADLPRSYIDVLYTGIRHEATHYATAIVGGNIASSSNSTALVIDITLLGTIERGHAITRSGAQSGDTLMVTGALGDSAAGLYTLLHPSARYPRNAQEILRTVHRAPQPRVRVGRILSQFGPEIITSMLDISDGLSGDLAHLCTCSNVGVYIELAHLPLSSSIRAVAASIGYDPFTWALHGGEDYELLFTVSPGHAQEVSEAVHAATSVSVTAIGTMLPSEAGMKVVYSDGHEDVLDVRSWNHLKH